MCKCTPEIRTPFCGKPGCEWPAQTATQMRLHDSRNVMLQDRRYQRAAVFTAQVMRLVDRYICDHHEGRDHRKTIHAELMGMFHGQGFDTITDADRAAAGLPLRNDAGWTDDELRVLENQKMLAMNSMNPVWVDRGPIKDFKK